MNAHPPPAHISAHQLSWKLAQENIVSDISLTLVGGQLSGLIGPNGSGKSSILKLLAGITQPTGGELRFAGQAYGDHNRAPRARQIAYIPQDPLAHWPITVERLVELGRLPHLAQWQSADAASHQAVEAAMQEADVLHLRSRSIDTLSGGEKARVSIARALAGQPSCILADEPVAALDPAHQLSIMALLAARCRQGASVCVSLHELTLAARYCDQLILLNQGRMVASGPPQEVLSLDRLREIYGIRPADPHAELKKLLNHPWEPG